MWCFVKYRSLITSANITERPLRQFRVISVSEAQQQGWTSRREPGAGQHAGLSSGVTGELRTTRP